MATEAPHPWIAPLDGSPARRFSPAVATGERVPTGVADFDFLSGGIPIGSVVLLVGEAGAGQNEFALTSAVHMMLHHEDPKGHELFLGNAQGPFLVPSRIAYLSATRSREQVLREVASAFEPSYHSVLEEHLDFHDLSPSYFVDSSVPSEWSSIPSRLLAETPMGPTGNALSAVADALEVTGPRHLVILDSLTDLLVRRGIETESVLTLIKGLRRRAKEWKGVVYLLLARGVVPDTIEKALYDSVDGVLAFSWTTSPSHSHRQRAMIIEKFMPVLSRIPPELLGRFVIRVSALNGLVTTQYERI